eukprot:4001365-Amphidinium_carterae.1
MWVVGGTGHESLVCARRLMGRCARIAKIVPQAAPFSSAFWVALAAAAGAEREAPLARPSRTGSSAWSGCVPAVWQGFKVVVPRALIDGRVLPLQRRVYHPSYPHCLEDDGAGLRCGPHKYRRLRRWVRMSWSTRAVGGF